MQNSIDDTGFERILERVLDQEFYGPLRKVAQGRKFKESPDSLDRCFYSLMSSSFFDSKVQKVMSKHFARLKETRPSIPVRESANRFLQEFKNIPNRPDIETLCRMEMYAFPLWTWNSLNHLASDTAQRVWSLGHEDVIYCYRRDPVFCAELLTVLTAYYAKPEYKQSVGEMLAENVAGLRSNIDWTAARRVGLKIPSANSPAKSFFRKPMKWDEIACLFNKSLKNKRESASKVTRFVNQFFRMKQGGEPQPSINWHIHYPSERCLRVNTQITSMVFVIKTTENL